MILVSNFELFTAVVVCTVDNYDQLVLQHN